MKKVLVIALIAVACVSSVFSSSLLQIGGYVSYKNDVLTIDKNEDSTFKSLKAGPEVRVNLLMLSLDVPAAVGFTTKGDFTASLLPSINLSSSFLHFVNLAIGLGLQMDLTRKGSGDWYINGHDTDEFSDFFGGLTPFYRLGATVDIGFVSIGAALSFESSGTLDDIDLKPDWDQPRVSLSVLWNLL